MDNEEGTATINSATPTDESASGANDGEIALDYSGDGLPSGTNVLLLDPELNEIKNVDAQDGTNIIETFTDLSPNTYRIRIVAPGNKIKAEQLNVVVNAGAMVKEAEKK